MTLKGKVRFAAVSPLLVTVVVVLAGIRAAGASQDTGPVYSIEGAWYGITVFAGNIIPPTPTLDTFTSDAQRHMTHGSFLCTIPADMAGGQTPSGHGNWVRVGANKYAYTAMRAVTDGQGAVVGWARFWGTITAVSEKQLQGTINFQLHAADAGMTPISPVFSGTIDRRRVEVVTEN